MKNTVKEYLRRLKLLKDKQKRLLALVLVLSVIVSSGVTWSLHLTGQSLSTDSDVFSDGSGSGSQESEDTLSDGGVMTSSSGSGESNSESASEETSESAAGENAYFAVNEEDSVRYQEALQNVIDAWNGDAAVMQSDLSAAGLYYDAAEHTPAAGELIFFDADGDAVLDSVGVAAAVSDTALLAMKPGEDQIVTVQYSWPDSTIVGYSVMPEEPAALVSGTTTTTTAVTETETESTTETETESITETETESATETETETITETETESATETETETLTETETESTTETETETITETEKESTTETETESITETETESATKTETESTTEPGSEITTEAGMTTTAEPGTTTTTEAGTITTTEPGTTGTTEAGTETTTAEPGTTTTTEAGSTTTTEQGMTTTTAESGTETTTEARKTVRRAPGTGITTEAAATTTVTETAAETTTEAAAATTVTETAAETTTETEAATQDGTSTTGLKVEKYLDNIVFYYKPAGGTEWIQCTDSTTIPGDASLRMEVEYAKADNDSAKDHSISLNTLIANNYTLTFTAPAILKDFHAVGDIVVENDTAGTISVSGQNITLTYNADWVSGQIKDGKSSISSASFYVEGKINLTEIKTDGTTTYTYGDVTVNLKFDENSIAQYGDVSINKSVEDTLTTDTLGNYYLKYTLKVTAGSDGMPGVYVTDALPSEMAQYLEGYASITGSAETPQTLIASESGQSPYETIEYGGDSAAAGTIYTAADNQSFTWTIGTMQPNEVRTLVYYVKVKDAYIGASSKGSITNTAQVHTRVGDNTYDRSEADATFTPVAKAYLEKGVVSTTKNDDGTYTLKYRVFVRGFDNQRSNAANSWALQNVKITDYISNFSKSVTDRYLNFELVEGSFLYYNGYPTDLSTATPLTDTANFTVTPTENRTADNPNLFEMTIGELASNASYTFTYEVKVSARVLAELGGDTATLTNQAASYFSDDVKSYQASANVTLQSSTWTRKLGGDALETQATVSLQSGVNNEFYDLTSGTLQKSSGFTTFTVPAGSVQYHVLVNEEGKWDVNSATFTDQLTQTSLVRYSGWLKIAVYDGASVGGVTASSATDADAISAVQGQTALKYIWVKVNNLESFRLTPASLGLSDSEEYVYLLEYYVAPKNADGSGTVVFENSFTMTGQVGIGGVKYTLGSTEVTVSSSVVGTYSLDAEKSGWYYDSEGGYNSTGALYWMIEVDASNMQNNTIPSGTVITDQPAKPTDFKNAKGDTEGSDGSDVRKMHAKGVWVFRGASGLDLSQYSDITELLNNSNLTLVGIAWNKSVGTSDVDTDSGLTWTSEASNTLSAGWLGKLNFTKDYSLGTDRLYVVVATEPTSKIGGKRAVRTYVNNVNVTLGGEGQSEEFKGSAQQTIYGSENILKENEIIFTWDGTTLTKVNGRSADDMHDSGGVARIAKAALDKNKTGTYVAWDIKINYAATLSGDFVLEDQLPEGVEIAYARIKWYGNAQKNASPMPTSTKLDMEGWSEHSITAVLDGTSINSTCYFYTCDKDSSLVRWKISNLAAYDATRGYSKFDNYSIDFQIVCRVTDEDVLLGNKQKTFTNNITLLDSSGNEVGTDNSSMTLSKSTMSKTCTSTLTNKSDAVINYEITVNDLAEDLVAGSDTVTLVDVLPDSLRLQTDSDGSLKVKVYEVKGSTETELLSSEYKVALSGQTLKVTLPDNKKLKVAYSTIVQAASGETVSSIANTAYWEGYETTSGTTSTIKNFSYTAGGTAALSGNPTVKVRKVDADDANTAVPGAQFQVTAVGEFEKDSSGATKYTPYTDAQTVFDSSETGTWSEDKATWTLSESTLKYNVLYSLVETVHPDGYIKDDTPRYFVFTKTEKDSDYVSVELSQIKELTGYDAGSVDINQAVSSYTYNFPNKKTSLQIRKTDEENTKTVLSGAEFTLYTDAACTQEYAVQTRTTGNDGICTFTELSSGTTYYLKETSPPANYVLPEDEDNIWTVVVDEDGNVQYAKGTGNNLTFTESSVCEITNERGKTSFTLLKRNYITEYNSTPQKLSGAEFTLYTDALCRTQLSASGTTNPASTGADGTVTFENLTYGETYYMKETAAPAGYMQPDCVWKIEVGSTGTISLKKILTTSSGTETVDLTETETVELNGADVSAFVIRNQSGRELPETGGYGTQWYTLGGLLIIAGALMYGCVSRRRRQRRDGR